jgi:hypothetical protein
MVSAVARHLLTAVGGGLAVSWGIDGATWEAVVAALATLAGLGWSIYDKQRRA